MAILCWAAKNSLRSKTGTEALFSRHHKGDQNIFYGTGTCLDYNENGGPVWICFNKKDLKPLHQPWTSVVDPAF
jgi:hypothetical protein